jgi:hypothetical protein
LRVAQPLAASTAMVSRAIAPQAMTRMRSGSIEGADIATASCFDSGHYSKTFISNKKGAAEQKARHFNKKGAPLWRALDFAIRRAR